MSIVPKTVSSVWEWLFDGASVAIPFLGEVAAWMVFFALAGIGIFVVIISTIVEETQGDDADGPRLPALQNLAILIQAIGGGGVLVTLYFLRHWVRENLVTLVIFAGIVFASWVVYVYLQNRNNTSRRDTAIRRTQRNVGNSIEDWVQAAIGAVFVVAAIVLSVLSGIFQSAGALDQYITPLLNEIGFGLLTLLGYVQLGGDRIPGASLVPELNPLQWVGLATVLFAGVVVFRD